MQKKYFLFQFHVNHEYYILGSQIRAIFINLKLPFSVNKLLYTYPPPPSSPHYFRSRHAVVVDVVKKLYDELVNKVNAIDTKIPSTSRLVIETQYHSDKLDLEKNVEGVDTSGLVKKIDYNTNIT